MNKRTSNINVPEDKADLEKFSIAIFASQYPSLTETFVESDIVGLKERKWDVSLFALHRGPPSDVRRIGFNDCIVVYEKPMAVISGIVKEMMGHPLATVRTIVRAMIDAVIPQEKCSFKNRLKGVFQAVCCVAIAHRLRVLRIRHLHCHFAHAPTTIGMYVAKQLGISFSFTGHANDLFQNRSLLKIKLQRCAFVASISQWHRDYYSVIEPSARQKCSIIRCGVDIDRWRMFQPQRQSSQVFLISVCRLVEKKGIDVLLHAIAIVMKTSSVPFRLMIVGDGPERQCLEKLAEELQCSVSVEWVGAQSHDNVHSFLSRADIFVLPCKTDRNGDRDGIPVAMMEAMAQSIPVIAGNLPAIRELVIDGQTGLLVQENDPIHLATRIQTLIESPEERTRLGAAGRSHVAGEFSREMNLDRFEERLKTTLRLSGAPL